ncbi:MAG TPA: gamma-glutamyltransferase [Streptosporangiaceae bacterium]|nr:gamma-glutamyltransferase [Streptosporangiaceae bacterium]
MLPQGSSFTTRPQLAGTFGMVASTHWLASAAGMAVLEAGGTAFDAAVAAGLVLQVVEPHMNGLGGEAPVIGYAAGPGGDGRASQGEVFVLDGQGPAGGRATTAAFSELGLDLIPGNGLLPACVPAAFGTWLLLLERYGRLPLRAVMRYAIGYARDGYPMTAGASAAIASAGELFRRYWPSSAEVYLRGGGPAPGARFANPALAATYQQILDEAEAAGPDRDQQIEAARRAYYQGFVAEAIDSYLAGAEAMDVTGQPHRALLCGADLAAWRASAERPVTVDFMGLTVCKTGPWGQGPVFLQQLALLDGLGLGSLAPGSADHLHVVIECAKLAFADREAWYGDPRFARVPLGTLLSPGYTAQRRALIGSQASAELRPGHPDGQPPRLPGYATGAVRPPGGAPPAASEPTAEESGAGTAPRWEVTGQDVRAPGRPGTGDTCHLDVADRFGNMVSATPSGGWLQSSPVIPGLGFCLGTRAQMFTLTGGLPNTLAPGKRPRTTLTPSLALRGGEPYLAFGTPGGDQQDQWTLAFFLNHVLFGMNLQEAIDAPAFHTRHFPSSFYPRQAAPLEIDVESRAGPAAIGELRARGHRVTVRAPWSLGRVSAVARDGGLLYAAANPRGMQGYAVGR